MALPSSDSGAGAAGVASNPPWTQAAITATTVNYDGSGHFKASAVDGAEVIAFVNDNVFSADHYAQFTIAGGLASGFNYFVGIVRGAKDGTASSFQGYEINGDGVSGASNTEYVKWVNGAATTLGSFTFSPQFTTSDVVKWQMSGTTLTLFRNGTSVATATDSTFSRAGAPGLGFFNGSSNTVILSNFTGDNNVSSAPQPQYGRPLAIQQRMAA